MDVVLSIGPLVWKARLVIIIDRGAFRIEEVEAFKLDAEVRPYPVAHATVERGRRLGTNAIILDQRTWSKISELQRAEIRPQIIDRSGKRSDAFHGAGNTTAHRVVVAEPRASIGYVGIDRQPVGWLVIVRKFKTDPPARSTRGRGAGIALEDELRVKVQPVRPRLAVG